MNDTINRPDAHVPVYHEPVPDSSYNVPWLPADSVTPFEAILDTTLLRVYDPKAPADTVAEVLRPDWHAGIPPVERTSQAANRSGFLFVIALLVVILMFNIRNFGRILKYKGSELWKVRPGRGNVFDEHAAADVRVMALLIVQCVVCCGILLCTAICRVAGAVHTPMTTLGVGISIACMALYYLFQLCAYSTVGYIFTDKDRRREWISGFNASQAILGLFLIVPAALALFYPALSATVVYIGAALYIVSRVLFIIKGFRIFYDKIGSLLYFILYLCTLEIIPVIFVYYSTSFLVMNVHF